MRRPLFLVRGLTTAGLLAGLWAVGPGRGLAQEPASVPPFLPTQSAAPAPGTVIREDATNPDGATSQDAAQGTDPDKKKEEPPPSLWSKVPPVRPTPRLGYFVVPPSGPGYYALRDLLEGHYRAKPPAFPYPPQSLMAGSFFDADFRYLDKEDNQQHDLFDPLKRMHGGDNWLLTFGGEERLRTMNEVDSRLSGKNNRYELLRTRVFGDLWYRDAFRLYVEYLDAQSFGEDLPPLPIDVNRSDFLNLFIDLKLAELRAKPVYARVGRQELLYGSERLISPLEWANTRRTFQGVKLFRPGEKWDLDAFWVRPVPPDPSNPDWTDNDQNFSGIWATYRPRKGTTFDLYYLDLDQARPVATGSAGVKGGYNVSTVGSRYAGDYHQLLWDFEGMVQFGDWANQDIFAGSCATGLGWNFAKLPLNPQFWVDYEFASGDHNPGVGGTHGTFNQLSPFGHYYFGYLDLVGRQNISDLNLQLVLYPAKWIQSGAQYHHFRLDSARDALYNAAGVPLRIDPTGQAGTDVGNEMDFWVNFHLSMHQDILVGYSKLFAGDFIQRTGSPLSPELFYLQYSFRW